MYINETMQLFSKDYTNDLLELDDVFLIENSLSHTRSDDQVSVISMDVPFDLHNVSILDLYRVYNEGITTCIEMHINITYYTKVEFVDAWWDGNNLYHSYVIGHKEKIKLITANGIRHTQVVQESEKATFDFMKHDDTLYLKTHSHDNCYDFFEITDLYVNKHVNEHCTWLDIVNHFNKFINVTL